MAIKMANKVGTYRPGGGRGDTEQVAAQWQHSVASGVALVMLHQEMNAVLDRRTAMAIEMACNGGAFVCCYCLFCLTVRTMIWFI